MLTFLILAHMADPSGGIADPSGGILTFLAVPYMSIRSILLGRMNRFSSGHRLSQVGNSIHGYLYGKRAQ